MDKDGGRQANPCRSVSSFISISHCVQCICALPQEKVHSHSRESSAMKTSATACAMSSIDESGCIFMEI